MFSLFVRKEKYIYIQKNSTLTGDVNKAGAPVHFQPLHCLKLEGKNTKSDEKKDVHTGKKGLRNKSVPQV